MEDSSWFRMCKVPETSELETGSTATSPLMDFVIAILIMDLKNYVVTDTKLAHGGSSLTPSCLTYFQCCLEEFSLVLYFFP